MPTRLPLLLPTLTLAGLLLAGWLAVREVFAHDRPAGPLHKTRSTALAHNGMACTSQPLATEAALSVLRDGGNAIDAAGDLADFVDGRVGRRSVHHLAPSRAKQLHSVERDHRGSEERGPIVGRLVAFAANERDGNADERGERR